MNTLELILLALAVAASAGFLWTFAAWQRTKGDLRATEARLETAEDSRGAMADYLKAQAGQTAAAAAEEVLKRADESLRQRDLLAQQKLEAQLKPMTDRLTAFAEHVAKVEEKRIADGAGLKTQIEQLMTVSAATQDEARKLSNALRRGAGIQGRWGEQMLRNVLELAGLRAGVDFDEQVSVGGDDGRLRPDVVVRLPGGGLFVIDSKVSMTDYQASLEATDDLSREAALNAHADSVRRHIQNLSSKAYWNAFDKPPHSRSPDVVVLFMPLESAFACLAERQPHLVAEAWEKRVAVVTPMALFPLLKAVAYGWRAEDQAANAREIADAGRELHKRVSVIAKYAQDLGSALDRAVERYNDFAGSLERNVLTQARRFEGLSASSDRAIPAPDDIVTQARPLNKLTAPPPPAPPT